jgi:serine/threonine protein kinase
MNSLFLHDEFKPYLKEQRFYYFVAPEAFSQKDYSNIAIWSLGILLYYIIY